MKVALAVVALAIAAVIFLGFFRGRSEGKELTYFYDLSEKKLFPAPRNSIAPIRGINDAEQDAVRAIVISTTGNPKDKANRKIAYLETCSPELKAQLEAAQSGNTAAVPPRGVRQALMLVRRLEEADWYPVSSAEGEKIMTEWQMPGPGGKAPVVCAP